MDDLISRQAAIDAVRKGCQEWLGIFQRCEENIKAIEAEPVRHGLWVDDGFDGRGLGAEHRWKKCSECGYTYSTPVDDRYLYRYCPRCGAKMDGVKND